MCKYEKIGIALKTIAVACVGVEAGQGGNPPFSDDIFYGAPKRKGC